MVALPYVQTTLPIFGSPCSNILDIGTYRYFLNQILQMRTKVVAALVISILVARMCGVDGSAGFRDHHHNEQDGALSLYYLGELK